MFNHKLDKLWGMQDLFIGSEIELSGTENQSLYTKMQQLRLFLYPPKLLS